MTWAEYIAWFSDPINQARCVWQLIVVLVVYHVGFAVGRKFERKQK